MRERNPITGVIEEKVSTDERMAALESHVADLTQNYHSLAKNFELLLRKLGV